jgi:hypothetical protein
MQETTFDRGIPETADTRSLEEAHAQTKRSAPLSLPN